MKNPDTNSLSTSMPKPDTPDRSQVYDRLGKKYRMVKCENCHKVLCYEYIFRGRIIVPCSDCAMLTVMVFRQDRTPKTGRTSLETKKGKTLNGGRNQN